MRTTERPSKLSKTSGGPRANIARQKRSSESYSKACAANTISLSFAAAKASPRACITVGRRNSFEAGKRALNGDTDRAASTSEEKDLRYGVRDMKELVADRTLENRVLKKA